jgi:hypothetical protein
MNMFIKQWLVKLSARGQTRGHVPPFPAPPNRLVSSRIDPGAFMPHYEYQVVPAPKKGEKTKGAKTTAERFAVSLTTLMNKMGSAGWEYIRADTLPCEERVGLTGSKTAFQNMLVFRRELHAEAVEMLEPATPIKTIPPLRREPKISPIPAELFAEPEPDDVEDLEDLPKISKPTKTAAL